MLGWSPRAAEFADAMEVEIAIEARIEFEQSQNRFFAKVMGVELKDTEPPSGQPVNIGDKIRNVFAGKIRQGQPSGNPSGKPSGTAKR